MSIHESSINYQNLIRDLAEMYTFEVAEIVVVELIANSLDAKATCIEIDYNPSKKIITIQDNGSGMDSHQFDEYHDFAAGLKKRGTGIGFAGLGAKISFNIADRVTTETKSRTFSGGSNWYMQSNKKLIWEDIQPTHLRGHGTRVEVRFKTTAKPFYASTEDLIKLIRRHYFPLMESKFLHLYESLHLYSKDLRFIVNGRTIKPIKVTEDLSLSKEREFYPQKAGKKFGYGIFGLSEKEYPIAPDVCGVLLCTYGKVIKADLFNQFPSNLGPRLFGIVEIPEFIKFLTTSKTDFIHKRKQREFETLYDPIRQEFKDWLKDLGIETSEIKDSDEAIKLERELKKLIEDIPELAEFFGFRSRKNVLQLSDTGSLNANFQNGIDETFPIGEGSSDRDIGPVDVGNEPGKALVEDDKGSEKVEPISRKSRKGPKITFFEAPNRVDLAWVEGNCIFINTGHPCYAKTHTNITARRLHNLFAIASAIQRFLGNESTTPDLMFIDRMMSAWGSK